MTHVQKMYQYFKQHEGQEVNHRVFIVDLVISEYTGRMTDLRRKLGCTCSESQTLCSAFEHVRNTRKNYYMYLNEKSAVKEKLEERFKSEPIRINIKNELDSVRERLETETDTFKRKTLEFKEKMLLQMSDVSAIQERLL